MPIRRYLLMAFFLIAAAPPPEGPKTFAIVGATMVDTSNWGASNRDVADSIVVVRAGKIVAAGPAADTPIPPDAERVDARGKFLIPGLIDGFSSQDDQGYANAHLAMGVTTVIIPPKPDERRGSVRHGRPEPDVLQLDEARGYDEHGLGTPTPEDLQAAGGEVAWLRKHARRLTDAQVRADVDAASWTGAAGVMLMYPLDDHQVRIAADQARKRGLFTIGELGHASYTAAARAGVRSFIHVSRIELELAPEPLRSQVADAPFAPPSRPSAQQYNRFLIALDTTSPAFRTYARTLAQTGAVLMPTLALGAGFLPGGENPWASPIGALIDPGQVEYLPYDRQTGLAGVPPGAAPDYAVRRRARAEKAQEEIAAFHAEGVHFLAASGSDAFGVLPGWGEHREIQLLAAAGLSAREALAAATSNYGLALGLADRGRIAPGTRADLVLLDADPTRDVAALKTIRSVWLAGQRLDPAALLSWRPPPR